MTPRLSMLELLIATAAVAGEAAPARRARRPQESRCDTRGERHRSAGPNKATAD